MFGLTLTELRFAGYALLMAAALAGYAWWSHSLIAQGEERTETKYVMRDAKAAQAARDRIAQLETERRETVVRHENDLSAISTDYEIQLEMANAKSSDDQRRVAAGFRLRDSAAVCPSSGGGSVPNIAASPSASVGQAGAELSGEATQFLLAESDRADAVVRQLTACQAVTQSDRK